MKKRIALVLTLAMTAGLCGCKNHVPISEKILLANASQAYEKANYVTKKEEFTVKGVQNEQTVDIHVVRTTTYDAKKDIGITESNVDYQLDGIAYGYQSTSYRDSEKDKDGNLLTYEYTSGNSEEEEWFKIKQEKSNPEFYMYDYIEKLAKYADKNDMDASENKNDGSSSQEYTYHVSSEISSKMANIFTADLDIADYITEYGVTEYSMDSYYDKQMRPVSLQMDFKDNVSEEHAEDASPLILTTATYTVDFSYEKIDVSIPADVLDNSVEKEVSTGIENTYSESDYTTGDIGGEDETLEYPFSIEDGNGNKVTVNEIQGLAPDINRYYGSSINLTCTDTTEYADVYMEIYDYSETMGKEDADQYIQKNIQDSIDTMKDDAGFFDVTADDKVTFTSKDGKEVNYVVVHYAADGASYHVAHAFIELKAGIYLYENITNAVSQGLPACIDIHQIISDTADSIQVK